MMMMIMISNIDLPYSHYCNVRNETSGTMGVVSTARRVPAKYGLKTLLNATNNITSNDSTVFLQQTQQTDYASVHS